LAKLRMRGGGASARVYRAGAEDGLGRLSRILARLAEATRLEASLATQERECYDLARVVADCAEGYRLAYPGQALALAVPARPLPVLGSPDLAAQLLDKLVANAVDFSIAGQPVSIRVEDLDGQAVLTVANRGPLLPAAMADKLFESMVSVRPAAGGGEPHLGLGLYVARLIAEFHQGRIQAENLATGDGVAVTVRLPVAPPQEP
jgi:signal transduction histidine kinase